MNYTHYYALFIFFASYAVIGMELVKKPIPQCGFTLTTDEENPQKFRIPLELAMQCQRIKDTFQDFEITEEQSMPIQSANKENVLHFISYLKKINHINTVRKSLPEKLSVAGNCRLAPLIQPLQYYLRTLTDSELIHLTHTIDSFDVIDYCKNELITTEITNRILHTNNLEPFEIFNNKAILQDIMQKISKNKNFESKFIQPYIDTLTEHYTFPRTEWRLQSIYKKICNCFSWNIIRYKPYYMNMQTNTIIKSEEIVDDECNTIKTNCVSIFRKNSSPITITLTNIEKITQINANADESIFICTSIPQNTNYLHDTYFVINLNNPDNPPQFYHACTFTQNNEELYISNDHNLYILNTKTGNTTQLNTNQINKPIDNIITNKDGTLIAVLSDNKIFITENKKDTPHNFNLLYINDWYTITNICLHPHNPKLYLTVSNDICAIDVNSSAGTTIHNPTYQKANIMGFISDDILFLGYDNKEDYFFNIKTSNYWTKKKSPHSIDRLALTTDYMNSIEEIKSEFGDIHNRRIQTVYTPIIDTPIISMIQQMNKGYLPLSALIIAKNKSDIATLSDNDFVIFKNQNENYKTIISNRKTVTDKSSLSRFTIFTHLYQRLKRISPTILSYGKTAMIYTIHAISSLILALITTRNQLRCSDINDLVQGVHSLIDQAFWLIE